MQQKPGVSTEFFIKALMDYLSPTARVEHLARILQDLVAAGEEDEAVRELVLGLRDGFGLDPSWRVDAEAETRNLSQSAIICDRLGRREQFADCLMAAYPMGSIRQEAMRKGQEPRPGFMRSRKEMLDWILSEWTGTVKVRDQGTFSFFRQAFYPGENGLPLLDPEKQMLRSAVQERLRQRECGTTIFSEPTLRRLMFLLVKNNVVHPGDEDLFRLLWKARGENGGWSVMLHDIRLLEEAGC